MAMKMKGSLRSDYDVQSYTDYIAGKRKYFTIYGMEFDDGNGQNTNAPLEPLLFLTNKCSRTIFPFKITTKLIKDYINIYGMETGIIHKGAIAYIKDSFLFMTHNIISIYDFEKLDDPEKTVADSFTPQGMWNYDTCSIIEQGNLAYQLHVASEHHSCEIKKLKSDIMRLNAENESAADVVKKLQDQLDCLTLQHECTKQISKNLEEMIVGACSSLSSAIDKNEKSNVECFEQLYKCIDKIGKQEQYCQEMEDEFAYLLRDQRDDFNKEIRGLELFTSTFLIIVTFIVGTGIAFSIAHYVSLRNQQQQQPEQSSALVCL